MKVQDNIRKIRQWKNLPQKSIAHKIGLPQSSLSRIEAGGDLSWSTLLKIAKALDVSIEDLIMFDSKIVFNQFGKKSNGLVINQHSSSEQATDERLLALEKENSYLKRLLEKTLTGKTRNKKSK